MDDPILRFQPERILDTLHRHGVRYVLIGGLAGVMHGATRPTYDIDISPEREAGNIERLAAALRELDVRIRTESAPEGLGFSFTARTLAESEILNLTCPYGDLDIIFVPSGTEGYEDLVRHAESYRVGDMTLQVASVRDLIRSKEASDRPKDQLLLLELREIPDR